MNLRTSAITSAAIIVAALISSCASSDSRLLGQWRSNRTHSVATFPHRKNLSVDKRAQFDGFFGRLTLTYTRRHVLAELPPRANEAPFRERTPYRVVAADSDSVTIKGKDLLSATETLTAIHFVGPNRYWVPIGTSGGREYFDRVDTCQKR
jgi:hypothetical protein